MNYEFPTPEDTAFPKMVVVSLTNACNYACLHCFHPTYVRQPGYKRHDMEPEVFHRIADELGEHPGSILRFIAWGEPLLHPQLVDFARYARQVTPGNAITLITNGYWLTPPRSKALMEAGLDLVEVSIDAATLETYRKLRVSANPDAFLVVENNVREMVRQRNEAGFKTRIAVSFILWPAEESKAEFDAFQKKWEGVADEIVRRRLHTFKGTIQGTAPLPALRRPCYGLWARCNINPWGQVSVCYNDWENKYILGDLRDPDMTIAKIWQGPALAQLRAEQCRGIFRGICAECRDYNPNAWEHPYEEVVARCFPEGTG